jgi:hypothetical protein
MSKTWKHKNKGKFNNGLLDEIPSDLKNMWDRSNNDWGEFRKAKKDLKDKIAEKELKTEIMERYKTIYENKVLINPPQNKNIDNLLTDVQGGIIKSIERLILRTPNDMELGKAVREMFSAKKELKTENYLHNQNINLIFVE